MIERGTSETHNKIKSFIKSQRKKSENLIDIITKASIIYLKEQIKHGADYIKIFDSWAGLLEDEEYDRFIIEPNKEISEAIKNFSSKTKQIFFPRGSSHNYTKFINRVNPMILALDNNYPREI